MYPLVATIGAAVNITMLTYNGTASVGVSSDDAAVADPDVLLEALRQGFSPMRSANTSQRPRRSRANIAKPDPRSCKPQYSKAKVSNS